MHTFSNLYYNWGTKIYNTLILGLFSLNVEGYNLCNITKQFFVTIDYTKY